MSAPSPLHSSHLTSPVVFDSIRAELALTWTLKRYALGGVRLPPGNRLDRALALFKDLNRRPTSSIQPDAAELERIRDAFLTAHEHLVIAHVIQVSSGGCTKDMRRRLEVAIGGADLEAGDKNPHARNMQFELYVGAVLSLGGVTVRFAEPDLRALYHGTTVGIAAKRLKGIGSIRDRMKEACRQVQKWSVQGFVAIGADMISAQDPQGARARPIGDVVPDLDVIDAVLDACPEVLGRILIVHEIAWYSHGTEHRLMFGTRHHVRIFTDSQDDVRRAAEFFDGLMARLHDELRRMKLAA